MANGIVWYGERGIVNALVADLSARGEAGAADGVRDLLLAVQWAGDGVADWIAQITRVTFLVEVSVAQFGNPDLILACDVEPGSPQHVVFVEAKVVPYLGSAMDNALRMATRGYNSSINGQLALRYRLSHALAAVPEQRQVVEPATLHTQYRNQLGDPAVRPRRLSDPCVSAILDPLRGLPPENYHFVAWTWDREPYFEPAAGVGPEYRPCFLTPDGGDAWEQIRFRVGWLGFESVETSVRPGLTYRTALATMLPALAPSATVQAVPAAPPLRPDGVDQFSATTLARVGQLADLAVEQAGASRSGPNYARSLSFDGIAQGKVVARRHGADELVLVGIRSTLSPQDWWQGGNEVVGFRGTGRGRRYGVFYFIRTPADPDDAGRVAGQVFQMIAERVRS